MQNFTSLIILNKSHTLIPFGQRYRLEKGEKMRKFLVLLIFGIIILAGSKVLADDCEDALKFFKNYVHAANNYNSEILQMYSPDAKIIRQVVKPDGSLVDVETDTETYINQLKLGQKGAKLRNYKNNYTDVKVTKTDNGCKISSLRQPGREKYRLKTYMIVKKQPSGKWLIVEEMMQTKVQSFLKYAKN